MRTRLSEIARGRQDPSLCAIQDGIAHATRTAVDKAAQAAVNASLDAVPKALDASISSATHITYHTTPSSFDFGHDGLHH